MYTLEDVHEGMLDAQERFLYDRAASSQLTSCTYLASPPAQPIYSCLTCARQATADGAPDTTAAMDYVAVCGACYVHCHAGHEVEELYEKRGVRCDCPTLAGRASPPRGWGGCGLNAGEVYPRNEGNVYTHNYAGRYCRCDGAHDPTQDVMYQCDLCLDWFHERCITTGEKQPRGEDDLFVCGGCLKDPSWDFLVPYLLQAEVNRQGQGEERKDREVDLFPEVTKRKEDLAAGRVRAAELPEEKAGPVAVEEVKEAKADVMPGWTCAHCSYFNRPAEAECFGCEKPKKEALTPAVFSGSPQPTSSTPSAGPVEDEEPIPCTRVTLVPASWPSTIPHDIWLSASYPSTLCRCDDCLALYSARAPFLSPFVDPAVEAPPSPPAPTSSVLVERYLESLPRDRVLDGMAAIQDWNEVVMSELARLAVEVEREGGEKVVTEAMVQEVVRQAKEECVRRRRRRLEEENEDGREGEEQDPAKRGRFD